MSVGTIPNAVSGPCPLITHKNLNLKVVERKNIHVMVVRLLLLLSQYSHVTEIEGRQKNLVSRTVTLADCVLCTHRSY